ncbi:MAG: hypothetical protein RBS77_05375 [Candidatus Moranbacteria bacterium]|jgi:hypothetical protein|nr:hypothetical protein [Candidatus Moranbacteria bacterium]
MINKKVSTVAGSLIILAIVIAIGFVFLSSKEKEVQDQNNVALNNSDLGGKEEVKQDEGEEIKNTEVKENETENKQEEIINTSDWKNYSDEKISFSYPSQCDLRTGSDSPSNKNPNIYFFNGCLDEKNALQILLYNGLSEKYVKERINDPTTTKVEEFQLSSGEKVIMLNIQKETTKESKFLSFVSKKNSATFLEVYGPLITASSKEVMTYEEFIKSIRIK